MATNSDRRRRESDRERRQAAIQRQRSRAARRRKLLAAGIGIVVVLAGFAGFLGARDTRTSTTTTTASTTTSTVLPADGVAPVPAAPGATLTGPTPCPAEDGSSPRTTRFASAPPMCIDTSRFLRARFSTTAGDFTVQLNPRRAPQTVNTFVVLARYRYYDGQPLTTVRTRGSFSFGMAFTGSGGEPGFAIPGEIPAAGTVFTPGSLSMAPASASNGIGGRLVLSTFEAAPGNDQNVTPLGIMLDGDETLSAIDALASRTGLPTSPVSIRSITITTGGTIS